MRRHHHLTAWVLLTASLSVTGCDPGSPTTQSGDAAPDGGRCKQTIAQACAAGNLSFWGQGQNPCTTRPDQFAVKFDRLMYPVACNLQDCGGKYTVVYLRRSQNDTDAWRYIYDAKTGDLLEVEVLPWFGDGPYCLAGSDPVATGACTWGPSCNTGCSVSQSGCLPRSSVLDPIETQVCGPPTIMSACDGSTTTFEGCSCSNASWSCTTADGGSVKLPSCDAGAD